VTAAIVRWWEEEGRLNYLEADTLPILADAGGSNGCRPPAPYHRIFVLDPQHSAHEQKARCERKEWLRLAIAGVQPRSAWARETQCSVLSQRTRDGERHCCT
jgi:hypothetical protein